MTKQEGLFWKGHFCIFSDWINEKNEKQNRIQVIYLPIFLVLVTYTKDLFWK